ncbi:hypothetical protein AB0A77_28350 [Streptomyces varsoviensis]|uniref:hypothetical protein n=1 Tax=Streptomyces varsoviensis TaxID=67373 RepID=UPI0034086491
MAEVTLARGDTLIVKNPAYEQGLSAALAVVSAALQLQGVIVAEEYDWTPEDLAKAETLMRSALARG